jgi:hypothetical protein
MNFRNLLIKPLQFLSIFTSIPLVSSPAENTKACPLGVDTWQSRRGHQLRTQSKEGSSFANDVGVLATMMANTILRRQYVGSRLRTTEARNLTINAHLVLPTWRISVKYSCDHSMGCL